MKAMVLVGKGQFQMREIPVPETPADGVLVRAEAVAICNATDARTAYADDPTKVWPYLPWPSVIGHETCGRIVQVGGAVKGWEVGDRIAGWCPRIGGFAEYSVMHPDCMAAVKVPSSMPASAGAMLELTLGTIRFLMRADVHDRLRRASAALVTGLGPAGLLYVQELRLLGVRDIYGVDRHPARQALARRFGARDVFAPDPPAAALLLSRGVRVDVAVDTSGKDLSAEFLRLLNSGGVIVPFGVGHNYAVQKDAYAAQNILLADGGHAEARLAAPLVLAAIRDGRLPVADLITRVISLGEIPQALEALGRREEIKVVVTFPESAHED